MIGQHLFGNVDLGRAVAQRLGHAAGRVEDILDEEVAGAQLRHRRAGGRLGGGGSGVSTAVGVASTGSAVAVAAETMTADAGAMEPAGG